MSIGELSPSLFSVDELERIGLNSSSEVTDYSGISITQPEISLVVPDSEQATFDFEVPNV